MRFIASELQIFSWLVHVDRTCIYSVILIIIINRRSFAYRNFDKITKFLTDDDGSWLLNDQVGINGKSISSSH